jgi:hypothetical protein
MPTVHRPRDKKPGCRIGPPGFWSWPETVSKSDFCQKANKSVNNLLNPAGILVLVMLQKWTLSARTPGGQRLNFGNQTAALRPKPVGRISADDGK